MKKPEDWYSEWLDSDFGDMLSFVKDIQTEAYNQAIDDAVKYATVSEGVFGLWDVNEESILKLKNNNA